MRRCSTFWNGVNSLIVPIQRDGRIPPGIAQYVSLRGVDHCYVHPSVETAKALQALTRRFGSSTPMWDGFDRNEVHPLLFQPWPIDDYTKPSLMIPRFESKTLRRIALACWGHIPDDDLPHWRGRFNVGEPHGDMAFCSLVLGQTGVAGTSPLLLSATGMSLVHQRSPLDCPYLAVIGEASFTRLVDFWNWRSRALIHGIGHAVVGLPTPALRVPTQLRSLTSWLRAFDGQRRTPDLLVAADERDAAAINTALVEAGLDHQEDDNKVGCTAGPAPAPEKPVYRFHAPIIGGPFARGAFGSALIAFTNGRASLALSQPPSIHLTSGHTVRVVLRNLPTPLPIGTASAQRIHRHATASDGVMLNLGTYGDWNLDIVLPTRMEALQDFAQDHGASVRVTQDGRYAEALLERLGTTDRLNAVATEAAVRMLDALTPKSRPKAAQELRRQLALDSVDVA